LFGTGLGAALKLTFFISQNHLFFQSLTGRVGAGDPCGHDNSALALPALMRYFSIIIE
jgi:hypothetical protein